MTSFVALCTLLATLAANPADEHVRAGAKHFRAGRFSEALMEFDVARARGADGEVLWYRAAALTKLGRSEDALEAFAVAQMDSPQSADVLLRYYEALACYDAHLLSCADDKLIEVGQRAGPRIGEQVLAMRAAIAKVLEQEPSRAAIDALLSKAVAAEASKRSGLAKIFRTEAERLAARRADRYGGAEGAAKP